jgi:drug/metabolite transporter (DMT)-like permease
VNLVTKGNPLNKKSVPYVLLLGCLFGISIVVSRFSVRQYKPVTFIGLRLTLASLGFIVVFSLGIGKRSWPRGRDLWWKGFLLGVFGTAVPMTGIVSSLQYLSSGLTSILITVNPAFTVVLAHFFLDDEPLTRRKSAGVLLALGGGVSLVILGESGLPAAEQVNPVGYVFALSGMLAGSTMTVFARKYMGSFDALDVTGIRMFAGALVLVPISFLLEGFDVSRVNPQGFAALIFAAIVGTFLGFLLSFYNIQRFGATAAVMTAYVVPVVAGLIGFLFLDEQVTWGMALGIALIILGVWMINSTGRGRSKIPETYV